MANFSVLIQDWFRLNRRNLPWRETFDPFKIWLSEIILQQTRVDQGMAYYLKFVDRFPAVTDLANAPEDEVLNLWQGLGYYSRARNMHFSAKYIVENHSGKFPETYKEVLALKGVGEYTAAAITSIAFGLPHAVVDGNVYRVLSRYMALATPIDSNKGKKEFKEIASAFLDESNPGDHNQALMELGALVCLPKKPLCNSCPIGETCLSRQNKTQLNYPVKEGKTKVSEKFFHYLIVTDGKKLLIKKRTGKGIWQGLYDFPLIEKSKGEKLTREELDERGALDYQEDGTFKHILSHQKIQATFWVLNVKTVVPKDNERVISIQELEDYPLPQLLIRYIEASSFIQVD